MDGIRENSFKWVILGSGRQILYILSHTWILAAVKYV